MDNIDVSGIGLSGILTADKTFPAGVAISAFSDDLDPVDIVEKEYTNQAVGLNGHLITWTTAQNVELALGIIPGTEEEANLDILQAANFPVRGVKPAIDSINLTLTYPDGSIDTYKNGRVKAGTPGRSVAAGGRRKSRVYRFVFESVVHSAA